MRFVYLLLLLAGLFELAAGARQCWNVLAGGGDAPAVAGTFANAGVYGMFVSLILPLAWHYVLRVGAFRCAGRTERVFIALSVLYVALSLCMLPLSQSRTAWLAALAGCGATTYWRLRQAGCFHLARWMLGAGLVAVALCLAWGYGLKKDSADGRLLIWKVSLSMVADRFPDGVGEGFFAGAYGEAQEEYFRSGRGTEREEMLAGAPNVAYNEYIQVVAELGWKGLLLLLLFVVYPCWHLHRSGHWAQPPVAGAFVALLVAAFFSYPLRNPYTLLLSATLFLGVLLLPEGKDARCVGSARYAVFAAGMAVLFVLVGNEHGFWGNRRTAYRQWAMLQTHFRNGRFAEVAESYAVLYPYLKREAAYLFEYGQCLSRTGAYEESNRVLQEGARRSSDPMFLNIQGKNFHCLGNDSLAEQLFRKASFRIPHKIYPLYLLMELYRAQGREEEWRQIGRSILDRKVKVYSPETEYLRGKVRRLLEGQDAPDAFLRK